jgi:hypothetical protein
LNGGVTPSRWSMIVLQLWPAEGLTDLTMEGTIAALMERHSRSVVVAVHLVYLLLRGQCFYKVVEGAGARIRSGSGLSHLTSP